MLNNGGLNSGGSSCGSSSGGMGTPDLYNGGPSPTSSSSDYPPAPTSASNFPQQHYAQLPPHHPHHRSHHPHHPHHQQQHDHGPLGNGGGGGLGHHSGGICSQMSLNQGACPQDSKIRSCGGCGDGILDRVLFEAWDRYWHHSCLKCALCGCQLADIGPTCFSRDGMMLCKQDYVKMFGVKGACRGCGQHIPSNEFVMRAGSSPMGGPTMVFHVGCFTCSKCCKTLATGDRYSVLNGALFCEQDALKVMKQNGIGSPGNGSVAATNGPTPAPRKGKVGRPRRSRD
ncbi:LIM/homeobox protein Lhx9 isoform X1 [Folsomia candida]|uniref:LIM domain transcription factor LMO4.1 n=1 Tax=Folsomia candida TaxID=158441 RepID=A0A226D262_FOLCA|nr:LIM/homeobox protein Lhx9 isoform X1 [Folsomia candida]XP_035700627.1 LIM/homeobox protein Lhx9 isoform X1 [Folsomia candida]XP_035700628.1 LIM/homeobox protein Lhx9 isoform X1 [Folsomia candida]XP_035700629.1 LIM/homeobox protein Lhx9 isoform X1 [Folsomia candida]XP_035700630.1 LIM/homeobox protein Lhx9 isoform X1 [Folsomia candida]XP_035700631.1 LIM/homeobox protein Lhx9 isoform X1 [Folsomia candida]XP_035700632.1 LIM/homeobox protein Lhx9 isoform X1 [Folsomia candida]XP_035700633.1 LIM